MVKLDLICKKNDEYYTPKYAIYPILKYIPINSTIWCPFDKDESFYVKIFKKYNYKVINTHIDNGQDFFKYKPDEKIDFIISNPPYSMKNEVFERLFKLNIPFAMLVGVVGLFESKKRFDMFNSNKFEIMYFDKRISFLYDYKNENLCNNPPYSSVYVCSNMLPKQIVFEKLNK